MVGVFCCPTVRAMPLIIICACERSAHEGVLHWDACSKAGVKRAHDLGRHVNCLWGPDALDHARWACTLNDWDYVHPHAYTRVSAALDLHYADAPHDTPIHYDRTHRLYRPQNTLSALKSVRRRKFKFSAHEWYSHCDTCKFNLNSQTITFSLSSEDSKQLKEEQDRIISKLILKL